jgi:hypothetical protein
MLSIQPDTDCRFFVVVSCCANLPEKENKCPVGEAGPHQGPPTICDANDLRYYPMFSLSVIQLQRAREFISALGAYQYDSLANLLSQGFTHRFLPTSLNGMGMPVRNTQEFVDHLKEVKLAIEEFNVS